MKKILTIVSIVSFMEHCESIQSTSSTLYELENQILVLTQKAQKERESTLASATSPYRSPSRWDVEGLYGLLKEKNGPDPIKSKARSILRQIRKNRDPNTAHLAALALHRAVCDNCDCNCIIDDPFTGSDRPIAKQIAEQMLNTLNILNSQPVNAFFQKFDNEEIEFLTDFFCPTSDSNADISKTMVHAVEYLLDNISTTKFDLIGKIIKNCCKHDSSSKEKFLKLLKEYENSGNLSAARLCPALESDWREVIISEEDARPISQEKQNEFNDFQKRLDGIMQEVLDKSWYNFPALKDTLKNREDFINLIEELKGRGFSIGAMDQDRKTPFQV
jgi:hypothetical protein